MKTLPQIGFELAKLIRYALISLGIIFGINISAQLQSSETDDSS